MHAVELILGLLVAVAALVTLARKETDPDLKRNIVEKLSLMQGSKAAMDYLMELLK